MKIALIGYGAMGRLIEQLADEIGHHEVTVKIESAGELEHSELTDKLSGVDVAIDFTGAGSVRQNVEACLTAGVPIVEGTTGWHEQLPEIRKMVEDRGGAMIYGANFSPGVNVFYRLVDLAAELLANFPVYEPFIEEQHHSRKKDSPSGTALKLKDLVSAHGSSDVSIAATRAGSMPGTHRVGFDGPADQIVLEHVARSREGFAHGALMAAEWIEGRTGFYDFSEVIDEILKGRTDLASAS